MQSPAPGRDAPPAPRATTLPGSAPSVHALGLAVAGALVLAAAEVLPLDAPPLSLFPCPLRAATGIPCLSCGATHAFHFAMHGQLAAAFLANPLAAAAALLLALHCLLTALRLCGLRWSPAVPRPSPRAARLLRAGAVLLVAGNWLFVALRGAT